MLKQMLGDDKTEEVRESVVRSLALLMAFIDEPDKFSQVLALNSCLKMQKIFL